MLGNHARHVDAEAVYTCCVSSRRGSCVLKMRRMILNIITTVSTQDALGGEQTKRHDSYRLFKDFIMSVFSLATIAIVFQLGFSFIMSISGEMRYDIFVSAAMTVNGLLFIPL